MEFLKDLEALLVTNPTNIRYLTGFVGVDKRDAYLLLTKKKKYLFTTSLYLESAKKLEGVTVVEISREKPIEKALLRLNLVPFKGSTLKGIGFEENDVTVAEYTKLKKVMKKLIPTKNRIEKLRMIKRKDEIKWIRQAAKLTDQCFDFILGKIKPGVTERTLAWEIEKFFKERGADIAFSPIVAFGKNSSQPHYITGNSQPASPAGKLTTNNLILLDFGARVNGYCADMTRVVFVGKPKDEWRRTYQTVLSAQRAILDKLSHISIYEKPTAQISGSELDQLARKMIKQAGFVPYPHSLGHNVGLDIHEAPRLTIKKDPSTRSAVRLSSPSKSRSGQVLLPGMVFTIEPAIYVEGQYGIRIEDLVLLKKDGIDVLSQSTKEIIII